MKSRTTKIKKKKREKAQTVHGEIEYETVACTNCENDYLPEDVVEIGVVGGKGSCSYNTCDGTKYNYRLQDTRVLCENCAENILDISSSGRIVTTSKKVRDRLPDNPVDAAFLLWMGALFILLVITIAGAIVSP